MDSRVRDSEPPPALVERSRLSTEALARWRGLPIGCFDANPDIVLDCSGATQPVICMLEGGRGMFELGREVLELQAGATGLFVPEAFTGPKRLRCTPGRRIVLALDLENFTRTGLIDDDLISGDFRPDPEFYDAELAAVLRAMVVEVSQGCPNGSLLAESLYLGVALRVSQTHARRQGAARRERGRLSRAQLSRIDEVIQARLSHDISLAALASEAGFSKPHFTRLFKNTVGMPPHQYLIKKRVEEARRLLRETRWSLAEIASLSGFASQSHMTGAFSRLLGETPGQARRSR
jgi:AraC family transcriptional regulator